MLVVAGALPVTGLLGLADWAAAVTVQKEPSDRTVQRILAVAVEVLGLTLLVVLGGLALLLYPYRLLSIQEPTPAHQSSLPLGLIRSSNLTLLGATRHEYYFGRTVAIPPRRGPSRPRARRQEGGSHVGPRLYRAGGAALG